MDIKIKSYKTLAILILLVILGGFLAGILGVLVGRAYFRYLPVVGDLYVPQNNASTQGVVINEPNKVIVEQDVRISGVTKNIADSIFALARKKSTQANYTTQDMLGQAVALTSDGWLVSTSPISLSPTAHVIVSRNEVFPIEKIARDGVTGLLFIKVDARNFSVTPFIDTKSLTLGSTVLGYDLINDALSLATLTDLSKRPVVGKYEAVIDTDVFDQYIKLSLDTKSLTTGTAIFDLNEKLVGVTSAQGVLPSYYINFMFHRLLEQETLAPLDLGIRYAMTYEILGLGGDSQGAVLTPTDIKPAISSTSPLSAQLKSGDIITHVNDTPLDETTDLIEVLYRYSLDSKLTLKVVRGDKQITVEYNIK